MNAPAPALRSTPEPIESAPRMEHVSIEADPDAALTHKRPPHRAVRATFQLQSRLRGCRTEVSLLDEHYVSIKSERPKSAATKYVLDLRFVNAKPLLIRHVAWGCLAATIALLLAAGGSIWWGTLAGGNLFTSAGFGIGVAALFGAGISAWYFVCNTTESLDFTSVHGEVPLVRVLGGIGSARAGRRFFVELIKNIDAAKLARPQPKAQWLRDEMREHHRLRELNAITPADYEASKVRILAAHR